MSTVKTMFNFFRWRGHILLAFFAGASAIRAAEAAASDCLSR